MSLNSTEQSPRTPLNYTRNLEHGDHTKHLSYRALRSFGQRVRVNRIGPKKFGQFTLLMR